MTSAAFGTCADCHRPRNPDDLFCECGALLDYSAPSDGRTNGHANASLQPLLYENTDTTETEQPPGPFHPPDKARVPVQSTLRVWECPKCRALNPARLGVCWSCTRPKESTAAEPDDARRRRWWLFFREERHPLPAGQHEEPKEPLVSKDPRVLVRDGLIVAGVGLLLTVLVIAAVKSWHPVYRDSRRLYNAGRERVFPLYTPHHPSSVWPPRLHRNKNGKIVELKHPAADAFDRNLSTYWLSLTPRQVWDTLRINFKPAVTEFNDVVIFAGDPTAKTIAPKTLQLAFYRWEPHPDNFPDECNVPLKRRPLTVRRPTRPEFCLIGNPLLIALLNTPAQQRFSIGTKKDVAQIVITVRGTHRSTLGKKARAAITDIEFFDRH